jgi:hypothetical protein
MIKQLFINGKASTILFNSKEDTGDLLSWIKRNESLVASGMENIEYKVIDNQIMMYNKESHVSIRIEEQKIHKGNLDEIQTFNVIKEYGPGKGDLDMLGELNFTVESNCLYSYEIDNPSCRWSIRLDQNYLNKIFKTDKFIFPHDTYSKTYYIKIDNLECSIYTNQKEGRIYCDEENFNELEHILTGQTSWSDPIKF